MRKGEEVITYKLVYKGGSYLARDQWNLSYELGRETLPVKGSFGIFAFKTEEDAVSFASVEIGLAGYVTLYRGKGKVRKARDVKCYQLFCINESYANPNLYYKCFAPPGTVLLDNFIPMEIIR